MHIGDIDRRTATVDENEATICRWLSKTYLEQIRGPGIGLADRRDLISAGCLTSASNERNGSIF